MQQILSVRFFICFLNYPNHVFYLNFQFSIHHVNSWFKATQVKWIFYNLRLHFMYCRFKCLDNASQILVNLACINSAQLIFLEYHLLSSNIEYIYIAKLYHMLWHCLMWYLFLSKFLSQIESTISYIYESNIFYTFFLLRHVLSKWKWNIRMQSLITTSEKKWALFFRQY